MVLSELYGKYKLGIIANQSPGTQERIEGWGIGKYFDVVMASAEAGCAKPDPGIFTMALEKAGCDPNEAIMIGDRKHDIIGAKENGLDSIGVLFGYGDRQELTDAGATFIVASPAEIEDLILNPRG